MNDLALDTCYQDIFAVRGQSYHTAMLLFPHARDQEFLRVFDQVDMNTVKQVLDLPSGGGYLKSFLPDAAELDCIDPCAEFRNAEVKTVTLENLDLPVGKYDLIVNLAALHHVENQRALLTAMLDSLNPGGYLVVGDVTADTGIANFLDNFAGSYNQTGHEGNFLPLSPPDFLLAYNGAELLEYRQKDCPWVFANLDELLDFCRLLFGLVSVEDNILRAALDDYVGIQYEPEGTVKLDWQLTYLTLRKQN